jgi:hypothetical protein
MKAQKKGTDLERAIAAIEGCILRATPALSTKSYKIYTRRIIIVEGVKHEIDIWVEFDMGNNYKSIFIFESKNWQKKIGKNHIIIFSKKIEAAQAQRGFFVAKLFTKYAIAAAKLDPRVEVLQINRNLISNNAVERIHNTFIDHTKTTSDVLLISKTLISESAGKVTPIDHNAITLLNGEPISCMDYFVQLVNHTITEHTCRSRQTRFQPEFMNTKLRRKFWSQISWL